MHIYQAYLEAAGLPPFDHRNRRVSGSHTFAASNRPPQRRQASVFSRAVAFVKAWAERRHATRVLYAFNDRNLADIGLTRMDIEAAVNGTYVRQPEAAPIEYPAARQVSDIGSHGKDETMSQKYFIDVHDLESGTFNEEHMSEEGFVRAFAVFDETAEEEGVTALRAHVNVHEGKAYCYTKGADPEAVRRAHEKIDFPFESITEVKTVTGGELARTVRVTGGTTGSVANDNKAQTAA